MKWVKLCFNIIFSVVGWISSIIALYELGNFKPEIQGAVTCGVIILSICYIVVQIHSFKKFNCNSSIHNTQEGVNKYLLNWLKKGGRTVIFTRDLTWVNIERTPEIFEILKKKAENDELIICLYRKTEVTNELNKLGAKIYVHELSESQLKSRFTIVDYGTNNPKITVGTRNNNGQFVNERYDMNSNPNACHAFIELFELIKSNEITENKNLDKITKS